MPSTSRLDHVAPETTDGIRQFRFTPPPGSTRILLVRHGESAPARVDHPFPTVDGRANPSLHPDGVHQAELVGARLAATESISAIFITPLIRTAQTAAPLASALAIEPVVLPELTEVFLGEGENGELRRRTRAGDPILEQIRVAGRWDILKDAEPRDDFDARLQSALATIAAAHPDQTVVAVTHGGVIGQIIGTCVGVDGITFADAANASISEIVITPARQILRRFNDTAHLDTPATT